jgi:hypothetical protein
MTARIAAVAELEVIFLNNQYADGASRDKTKAMYG